MRVCRRANVSPLAAALFRRRRARIDEIAHETVTRRRARTNSTRRADMSSNDANTRRRARPPPPPPPPPPWVASGACPAYITIDGAAHLASTTTTTPGTVGAMHAAMWTPTPSTRAYVPPGAPGGGGYRVAGAPETTRVGTARARDGGGDAGTTTTTTMGTGGGGTASTGTSLGRARAAMDASATKKRRTSASNDSAAADVSELRPADPTRLSEDVRKYREERAKHWPSDRNVRAKLEAGEEERASEARRRRLREILAKQREMGHFEASQEIGEDGDGVVEPPPPTTEGGGAASTKVCRFWLQGGCRKGAACDFKHASAPSSDQRCRFFARGRCKSGSRCPFKHELAEKKTTSVEGGNPQTLLKKLLDKEIRRDEGRLLQLFRFFVNNDFFADAGSTKALWMFPWVDESVKVVDKRAALASLPPVDDEADEDERKIAETAPPPREKVADEHRRERPDMGFFAAYDSDEGSESASE